MLVIVPLITVVTIAVAAAYFMFEKKSLAQSLCVQEAVRMQNELGTTLQKLMALNPQATTLRRQRSAADRALKIAKISRHPGAIATAQAAQLAVILAQTQHRARQMALLSDATQTRARHTRQLRQRLRPLQVQSMESRNFYIHALAVQATPPTSLTPNYVRARPFGTLQQHRFHFQVDLEPRFLTQLWRLGNLKQNMECSTTLTAEDRGWDVKILAANARSN